MAPSATKALGRSGGPRRKIDILLTNRLAPVTVFQNLITRARLARLMRRRGDQVSADDAKRKGG
jgi:hypothetical protein